MTNRLKRLELTWIGKEERPRLEPRILLEDEEFSHRSAKVTGAGIFENRLIHGDNLLALKALEQEFTGKIKCVFIDPPYNTGNAFEHYDDGLEHSLWLSLIRDRLELLHRLLAEDGALWITIDDNECHYLKVLCDEIVAAGDAGYQFHRNHRYPGAHPLAAGRFFACAAPAVGARLPRAGRQQAGTSLPDEDGETGQRLALR